MSLWYLSDSCVLLIRLALVVCVINSQCYSILRESIKPMDWESQSSSIHHQFHLRSSIIYPSIHPILSYLIISLSVLILSFIKSFFFLCFGLSWTWRNSSSSINHLHLNWFLNHHHFINHLTILASGAVSISTNITNQTHLIYGHDEF